MERQHTPSGGGLSYDIFGQKIGTNRKYIQLLQSIHLYLKAIHRIIQNFPTRGIYIDIQAKALDLFKDKPA